MKLKDLKLSDVKLTKRLRPLSDGLDSLVKSIQERNGIIQPIIVDAADRLIAGRRRIEAAKLAGLDEIPAVELDVEGDDAKLVEIDENLERQELTVLERSQHLDLRKKIYERRHPDAPKGAGRPKKNGEIISSFSEDAAAKLGVTPRTVQQEVVIAEKIAPDVQEEIKGTELADKKTDLLALAKMTPEKQRVQIKRYKEAKAKGKKVSIRGPKKKKQFWVSDEFFHNLKAGIERMLSIYDQFGSASKMLKSKNWNPNDTSVVVELVASLNQRIAVLNKELQAHVNKEKKRDS